MGIEPAGIRTSQVTTFLSALFLAFAGTALARFISLRSGFVSHPDPVIPDHVRPVPKLGGLGFCLGAAAGASSSPTLFVGLMLFFLCGLFDDALRLRPANKFIAQLVATALALIASPALIRPFTGVLVMDIALSAFCIIAIVNAFNFIDVCDGLAATVAAITFACWTWIGVGPARGLLLAVTGAAVGFLLWNRPPARIFLGDSGSQAMGFLVVASPLLAPHTIAFRLWVPLGILWTGVPVFELIFVTWCRVRKGTGWWRGSPDHFALRLQAAGWSKSAIDAASALAVVVLWYASSVLVGAGWGLRVAMLTAVGLLALLCAAYLARHEVILPVDKQKAIAE